MEFETERLRIRSWSTAYPAEPLRAILTPAVLSHLPTPLHHADPERWIAERLAESDVFAVTSDGALIGLVMLAQMDAVHVGYLLAEGAWGKGFASELLRGLVKALSANAPMELRAGVAKDNPASARVLEKAGFQIHEDTAEMVMYQLLLT